MKQSVKKLIAENSRLKVQINTHMIRIKNLEDQLIRTSRKYQATDAALRAVLLQL